MHGVYFGLVIFAKHSALSPEAITFSSMSSQNSNPAVVEQVLSMYKDEYVYIHPCIHAYTQIYTPIRIRMPILNVYFYLYIYIPCMCACTQIRIRILVCVHMHLHVHLHVHVHRKAY